MATLKATPQGIEFYSRYDAGLVAGVKALPYTERKWQPDAKCWLVAMKHKNYLIKLCQTHLGTTPTLQGNFVTAQTKYTKLFRIEYIGSLKDRGDGSLSALGAIGTGNDLDWSVMFPEKSLRNYFEGDNAGKSVVTTTHYSALAIKRDATQQEIKTAWRKMVRRYHPDVNHDDDAAEMTQLINRAYEILRNPTMRKKYDVGLRNEIEAKLPKPDYNFFGMAQKKYWKPPIRCGLLLCDGHYQAGRFIVEKILQWSDITERGQTLVTSWDIDSNSLIRSWI